jgi:hypothetical protein
MNHSLQRQHRELLFLLIFFCLGCFPGLWIEAQARAAENGADYSRVDIKDGRISVSAKDVPLELLCKNIEKKSGVRFRIQEALLGDRLSIELKDLPLLRGVKRLLAHLNYMLCFDHRNRLSEVFIVGRSERHTPPILKRYTPRRGGVSIRRLFNRPSP